MTKLSVNINKLATIRNARGDNNPNLITWVKKLESFGAQGLTAHPRPDERHIRKQDIFDLKPIIQTEFNIEGYPSTNFIKLIKEIRPEQCTLVPDLPNTLTSNAGWNVEVEFNLLKSSIKELSPVTRVSIFVEPDTMILEHGRTLKALGAHRAELYTKEFAHNYKDSRVLRKYRNCANQLLSAGLKLNAGHDLNLTNLSPLITLIPEIKEVSIGHALICESLDLGMRETISKYLNILKT